MWIINGGANFLPFAIIPLVLAFAAVAAFRRRRLTLAASLPLIAWAGLMLDSRALLGTAAGCSAAPQLRAMTANVLMSNRQLDALAQDVLTANPDVVVFEELRQDFATAFPDLAARYPYHISTEEPWVTLASRLPLQDARRIDLLIDAPGRQPLTATVTVRGQPVTLFAIHVMPPLNAAANALHTAQYHLLAQQVALTTPGPLLVIGDFNATPLSPTFAGFLRGSGLRLSDMGDQTPTHFPRTWLGLRIDHVLERGFEVCGEQVVTLTGSDHRGVAVDLRLSDPVAPDAARR